MILLCRRSLLALAAVVDIAIHARPHPVAAKTLAGRLDLPPRHLETMLQALVRADILRGVRGPRGGYELARERRRITAAEVVRAAMDDAPNELQPGSRLVTSVIGPLIERAAHAFLDALDRVTIDDICREAGAQNVSLDDMARSDFTI